MAPKNIRRLIDKFGNMCHYCGEQCAPHTEGDNPKRATREHVVPKFYGGEDHIDNFILACADCNNDRGVMLFYCYCMLCEPIIQRAMEKRKFWDHAFVAMMNHNKPKVYATGDRWSVRMGYNRRHFNTFDEALECALNQSLIRRTNELRNTEG